MNREKTWSCQDLVDHAQNWSLAGNVGLLKHMEHFADNLFRRAEETDRNVSQLLSTLDATSVQLDLVKNHFFSLQNTQFIESRVYDDDDIVANDENTSAEVRPMKKLSDECKKQMFLDGLQVLETCYDRVSIPQADSESEENDADEPDDVDYMLRAKNPYIHRPLPFIIGTTEWHSKWHAGLLDSSEDEEETRGNDRQTVEEDVSDAENQRIPDDRRKIDENPIRNGGYESKFVDPEVNTRPIQKRTLYEAPILPPAIDEPPEIVAGLFHRPGGLFDDDDEDDLQIPPKNDVFDEEESDLFDDSHEIQPPPIIPNEINVKRGLFDETDDEDDDFLVVPPLAEVKHNLKNDSNVANLFDDDADDDFFVQPNERKMRNLFDESEDEDEDDVCHRTPLPVPSSMENLRLNHDDAICKHIPDIPLPFQPLQSITKDRVKIGVKRRPSTRQARKAALGKSGMFDVPQSSIEQQSKGETAILAENPPPALVVEEAKQTISLFDDDDFDDSDAFFAPPHRKQLISDEIHGDEDLFRSVSNVRVFDNVPSIEPVKKNEEIFKTQPSSVFQQAEKSLFSDDDDEFERSLFGDASKDERFRNLFENTGNGSGTKSDSLFDDDEDCESLFGAPNKQKMMKKSTKHKNSMASDPLDALFSD